MLSYSKVSFGVLLALGLSLPFAAGATNATTTTVKGTHNTVQSGGGAAAVIGTTPDEIQTRFASVIENNLANGSTEHVIGNLSDKELADIAILYRRSQKKNGKQDDAVLAILATRLGDHSLIRVARAFGSQSVQAAVNQYSAPNVRAAVAASIGAVSTTPASAMTSMEVRAMAGAAPNIDMTPQEIYLEYRTAPTGSLGVMAGLEETAEFMAKRLTVVASLGYGIGTVINNLIDDYDPELGDAIGGTINQTIETYTPYFENGDTMQMGQAEYALDANFSRAVSESSNPDGDWDDTVELGDYIASEGGDPNSGIGIPNPE